MPDVRLISCVGVRHDLALLPHYLRHYRDLGVAPSHMHILLNGLEDDAEEISRAQEILEEYGVAPHEVWTAPYTSEAMWEKRREVQRREASAEDWVISADVDEFCEFPDALEPFLAYCERRGANCIQGVFIDRLAADGRLKAVESEPSIWNQFPVQADVICTVRRAEEGAYWYGTVNIMACRGDVLPSRGGHHPLADGREVSYLLGRPLAKFPTITDPRFRFSLPLRVHHFKWTNTLAEGLRERLSTPGVSCRGQSYGRLLLDRFEQRDGFAFGDLPIREAGLADRVPWRARIAALRTGSDALRMKSLALRAARAVKRRMA
jgi:hypothetical protein